MNAPAEQGQCRKSRMADGDAKSLLRVGNLGVNTVLPETSISEWKPRHRRHDLRLEIGIRVQQLVQTLLDENAVTLLQRIRK